MTKRILALVLFLASCDTGSAPDPTPAAISAGDAAVADSGQDAMTVRKAHCCSVTDVFTNSKSACQLASPMVIPCDTMNQYEAFRFTCGTSADYCTDNGRSCAVGQPCTLVQLGGECTGVVQECDYPWLNY
jgi:hypothetical protein